MKEITLSTKKDLEIIDITDKVNEIVKQSKVNEGICLIYALHATAGITICESYDPNMLTDLENDLRKKFPPGGHLHDQVDDNAHSHLISSFIKPSQIVPVKNSELLLGTWQAIVFVEADGPRSKRTVVVEVIQK